MKSIVHVVRGFCVLMCGFLSFSFLPAVQANVGFGGQSFDSSDSMIVSDNFIAGEHEFVVNISHDSQRSWTKHIVPRYTDYVVDEGSYAPHVSASSAGMLTIVWKDTEIDTFSNYSAFGEVTEGIAVSIPVDGPDFTVYQINCDNKGNVYGVWQNRSDGSYFAHVSSSFGVGWVNEDISLEEEARSGDYVPQTVSSNLILFSVNGQMWKPDFYKALQKNELLINGVVSHHGFNLGDLTAEEGTWVLPWANVDRISIASFDAAQWEIDDLTVTGENGYTYAFQDFSFEKRLNQATWTLTKPLDGMITMTLYNGAQKVFLVLPADGDRDGSVSMLDVKNLREKLFRATTHDNYSPYYDFNGDGVINIRDALSLRRSIFRSYR